MHQVALIDWALDWAATNFSKNYAQIWYPVVGAPAPSHPPSGPSMPHSLLPTGFGPAPEDQSAENAKALANLETFTTKFLSGYRLSYQLVPTLNSIGSLTHG